MTEPVRIYKRGAFAVSVCAHNGLGIGDVIADVERQYPSGTERGWRLSDDTHFATGETNPCDCNVHPAKRRHWLLEA